MWRYGRDYDRGFRGWDRGRSGGYDRGWFGSHDWNRSGGYDRGFGHGWGMSALNDAFLHGPPPEERGYDPPFRARPGNRGYDRPSGGFSDWAPWGHPFGFRQRRGGFGGYGSGGYGSGARGFGGYTGRGYDRYDRGWF